MTLLEWFWRFLPDRCSEPGCCRKDVRDNENVIDGLPVCDYCHSIHVALLAIGMEACQP